MSLSFSNNNSDPTHQRRSSGGSGGFFHSLKKLALGGAKDVAIDPEFDLARDNFHSVFEAARKVRGGILSYIAALRSLISAAGTIANDIGDSLELKTAEPNQYSNFARDSRKVHSELVQQKLVAVLSVLETRALKRLDDLIEFCTSLQKRIEERAQMKEEFEYYSKKVSELKKEREKHLASGKKEDLKEIDKFDRNTRKLEDIRTSYTQSNANLLVDLRSVWERRADTFGPAGLEFVQGEKDFIHFYTRALDGLGEGMLAPAPAPFAATSNAPLAAAAGSVAAKTDDLIHSYAPHDTAPPPASSSSAAAANYQSSFSSSSSSSHPSAPGENASEGVEIDGTHGRYAKTSQSSPQNVSLNGSSPPPPPPQPPVPPRKSNSGDMPGPQASAPSEQQLTMHRTAAVNNPFDDVAL